MTNSKTPEFLVDGIFPAGEIHLIGGPSGSGKTRLLMQMLEDWELGKPLFGHASYSCKFSYFSLDRSLPSVYRTLGEVAPTLKMSIESLLVLPHYPSIKTFLASLFNAHPESDVFVLDGIARLVPGGKINDYKVVADFLSETCCTCQQFGKTVLGIIHSPKCKEGERYLSARQRILGSAAWAGYCETIMVLEPSAESDAPSNRRDLTIYPRQGDQISVKMQFSNLGKLVEIGDEPVSNCLSFLDTIPPNTDMTRNDILKMAQSLDISIPTVDRALRQFVADGAIVKPRYGIYRKSS